MKAMMKVVTDGDVILAIRLGQDNKIYLQPGTQRVGTPGVSSVSLTYEKFLLFYIEIIHLYV